MEAVEFEANIKNGNIEIPTTYRADLTEGAKVRVIVLQARKTAKTGFIAELIDNPVEVADFTPLTRDEAHDRSL